MGTFTSAGLVAQPATAAQTKPIAAKARDWKPRLRDGEIPISAKLQKKRQTNAGQGLDEKEFISKKI